MPKNTVFLSSIVSGSAVSYYLSGGASTQTVYAGSGTPWTAESTTPYELALNDVTGEIWVPANAPAVMQFSGGPPFRMGASPVYRAYDNMTVACGVQMRGTTFDNAVALLVQLKKILNTALFGQPCALAVTGGSNTSYYEIYSADVQETKDYLMEGGGSVYVIRAVVTWTLSPVGGRLSSGETLINAVTIGNLGTGSPDNVESYGTGTGDLIYEGQPLNVDMLVGGAGGWSSFYMASVYSRTYSVTGAATASTSTSASFTAASFDVSAALTNVALKARILGRVGGATNGASRVVVYYNTTFQAIYTSPWFLYPSGVTTLVDYGYFPLTFVRRVRGVTAPTLSVRWEYKSTNGASASNTLTSTEYLLYYDFAVINPGYTTSGNAWTVPYGGTGNSRPRVDSFPEQTNAVCIPYTPRGYFVNGTPLITISPEVRGTLPRYWSGASFWTAWQGSNGSYPTTETATLTVTHAPLYRTIRGGV